MVPLKRLLRPSSLVLFLCSLGIGALLFFIAPAPRAPRLPPQPGGYTALALEESVPDRETA
ncbi:MAG: hypothetical protein LBT39_03125, partial [Treponema sp.]|nr:hypothetical protein [Treponema sp.]